MLGQREVMMRNLDSLFDDVWSVAAEEVKILLQLKTLQPLLFQSEEFAFWRMLLRVLT